MLYNLVMRRGRRGLYSYLIPDESVLWIGKPVLDEYLSRSCLISCLGLCFMVLLSIWLVGTVSLLESIPHTPYMPAIHFWSSAGFLELASLLVTVVFVVAALYLSFGHYLTRYLTWRRIQYAITEERVMVYRGLLRPKLTSVPLLQILSVRINERRRGIGDMVIGTSIATTDLRWYGANGRTWSQVKLVAVPDVHAVYRTLQAAATRAVERSTAHHRTM